MGDVEQFSKTLKYYKRPEVQEALVRHAENREVSPRYGTGFGKRPDVLSFPQDVLEFAKRKTTSFHCSEERWDNPMLIQTGMSRKEADELRIGWDLVLDIDAKDWEISRLTAWLFIKALEAHNIKGVSVKFSGNKGWHIGVPWESFPEKIVTDDGEEIVLKNLFPEMPRAIAKFLIDYIGDSKNNLVKINKDELLLGGLVKTSINELAKKCGKTKQDLIGNYNPKTKKFVNKEEGLYKLHCTSCGNRPEKRFSQNEKEMAEDSERVCSKCNGWMDFYSLSRTEATGPTEPRLKITEIVEVDTVLLASRHLYRMPYSLHEKSGLSGIVVEIEDVLTFKKTDAEPEKINFEKTFLDTKKVVPDEAENLCRLAWSTQESKEAKYEKREFEVPDEAIPEELFPPCIKLILQGLSDGRKRAMFVLTNFLKVCGWSHEMIEERLDKWNECNAEHLKEVELKSHLRSKKRQKERFPPPNCKAFYQELGVCRPDETCQTIKNPAQYSVKLVKIGKKK